MSYYHHCRKAEKLISEGNYYGAIDESNHAIDIDPNIEEAFYLCATAYESLGLLEAAVMNYKKSLEINPKLESALVSLGTIYASMSINANILDKRLDGDVFMENNSVIFMALNCFDKALEINPNNYLALYNKGGIKASIQRFDDAIDFYDRVIELNPKFPYVYDSRGIAYGKTRGFNEALKDFDKAIQLNPNFQQAYYNKAAALMNLKRYDEAIKSIDQAINLNPKDTDSVNLKNTIIKKMRG